MIWNGVLDVNILKPSGYFTYYKVSHSEILPSAHTANLCFVSISEHTATLPCKVITDGFLGPFVELWKATIKFRHICPSVCPSDCLSVRMEHVGYQWTDFGEILSIFRKSVDKIQVSLKSDKNNGTLHEDQYTS